MADPLSIAASVVGLAGSVKTCIDLYDIITTSRRVRIDLNTLIIQLQTERIRFFVWCSATGLDRVAQHMGTNAADTGSAAPKEIAELLLPKLSQELVYNHIVSLMSDMKRSLEEMSQSLRLYKTQGIRGARFLELLGHRRRTAQSPSTKNIPGERSALSVLNQLSNELLEESKKDSSGSERMRFFSGPRWAAGGKASFAANVDNLRKYNDGLESILQLMRLNDVAKYQRCLDAAFASPAMAQLRNTWDYNNTGPTTRLTRVSEISETGTMFEQLNEVQEEGEVEEAFHRRVGRSSAALSAVVSRENLELDMATIELTASGGDSADVAPLRQKGRYSGKPVLLEWRYYSSQLSTKELEVLDLRMELLARLLHQSSSIPDFGLGILLGYFPDRTERRYGLVFAYPSAFANPVSLRDRLLRDLMNKEGNSRRGVQRNLDDRLRVARQIAASVYQITASRWRHKNIRSESIMFFDATSSDDCQQLSQPYLCGFALARRNKAMDATELLPSALNIMTEDREWQLYLHPEANAARRRRATATATDKSVACEPRSQNSSLLFDVYGLGIVLLEIALWTPIIKLCPRPRDGETTDSVVTKFQTMLHDEYEQHYGKQVRFAVGERYNQVVRRCIAGDFGDVCFHGETDGDSFVAAFSKFVVSELEEVL